MTLEQLRARFRSDAQDTVLPYLFADERIDELLNDAHEEAAIRGRLLHADANPAVCEIVTAAGVRVYPLHPRLYELICIRYRPDGDTRSTKINLTSREELDRTRPDWRDEPNGAPRYAMQDDTSIVVWPTPDRAGKLLLEGYRLPMRALANDGDKPEINAAHHKFLVYWALHMAFSTPDSETIDPQRAIAAEKEFTRYFGIRPDSDLRRASREDQDHSSKVFWG
jgi:hypothetical protein